MDLGATPRQAIRGVCCRCCSRRSSRASRSSFADTVDDFVTVRYLSGTADSEPLSVKIYGTARASPTPAVNAAATVMLIATLLVIAVGYLALPAVSARARGTATWAASPSCRRTRTRRARSGELGELASSSSLAGDDRGAGVRQHAQRLARELHRDRRPGPRHVGRFVVRHPGLDRLARGEVHDDLQDRAHVDHALHHGGDPVLPAGALRLEDHALGPDRDLARRRVASSSPLPATSANSPSFTVQPPVVAPDAVASIRFDTPRKSAT